jgi:hypothetical protein
VELAAAARKAGLGVRQTEKLVQLWRQALSADAQKFVVTHPQKALDTARSRPKQAQDPRLSSQGQWVQRRLRAATAALSKLAVAMGSGMGSEDRTLLKGDFEDLSRQMEKVGFRVGRNDAAGS